MYCKEKVIQSWGNTIDRGVLYAMTCLARLVIKLVHRMDYRRDYWLWKADIL